MSYRRFVTYLFQYQNGEKANNCGFAKVEIRPEQYRIQIQIQEAPDGTADVYLVTTQNQQILGLPIGNISIQNGSGRDTLLFHTHSSEKNPFSPEQAKGIYVKLSQNFIASQWVDEKIPWSEFLPDSCNNQSSPLQLRDSTPPDSKLPPDTPVLPETEEAIPEQQPPADADSGPRELHATQASSVQSAIPSFNNHLPLHYQDIWETQWQQFTETHPVFHPFEEAPDITAAKISLRDFKCLPQKLLPLANNNFLLHGYFNYKYLLFGYEELSPRKWFLGVPGTFQNQEQLLAGLFGFGTFRSKHVTKQKTGEFGYWCQYLDL